ncbi:hypothetical protein M6B38_358295 [Iris pallida]|uniref:Uncharacterized protein n=1 Tax=Iris pallida TaxID=29817 RepID=A0AAX6GLX5_IRIPA|nr:hypothetical protein M6B38_358295 [Iris pallida]
MESERDGSPKIGFCVLSGCGKALGQSGDPWRRSSVRWTGAEDTSEEAINRRLLAERGPAEDARARGGLVGRRETAPSPHRRNSPMEQHGSEMTSEALIGLERKEKETEEARWRRHAELGTHLESGRSRAPGSGSGRRPMAAAGLCGLVSASPTQIWVTRGPRERFVARRGTKIDVERCRLDGGLVEDGPRQGGSSDSSGCVYAWHGEQRFSGEALPSGARVRQSVLQCRGQLEDLAPSR